MSTHLLGSLAGAVHLEGSKEVTVNSSVFTNNTGKADTMRMQLTARWQPLLVHLPCLVCTSEQVINIYVYTICTFEPTQRMLTGE